MASVDYRLAPENPWPDQIIDVKCAVRFLRANALELGIDPNGSPPGDRVRVASS